MTESSSERAYKAPTIALHWVMAFVLTMTFGLGLYMVDMPLSPDKLRYYSWHKWIGVSLFILAALRLAVRLFLPRSPSLANSSGWQRVLASGAHCLLYLLMFAVPISGWLMSSAKGVPTVYLGLWQLPDLIDRNVALGQDLQKLHVFLNFSMAGIVVIHIAAALKHHLVDRDNVLAGMLPGLSARSSQRAQ